MSNVQRVVLSESVAEAVRQAQDADEAFALLNLASDFYIENQREMSLQEALQRIALVSQWVEALDV